MPDRHDTLWRVRFHTTRPLRSVPRPLVAAADRVATTAYRFEGHERRSEPERALFQYTLAGEGRFRDGRGVHRLPPGHGFLCRPAVPGTGYFYPPAATEPWEHLYFTFAGAAAVVDELVGRFGSVFRLPPAASVMTHLQEYRRFDQTTLEIQPGEGASLVTSLLGALADAALEQTRDTPNAWLVREACRLASANVEQHLNVTALAAMLKVTPEHLCRVFRKETGNTPLHYLTREKVRHACELLRDTTLSSKEIGARLGFDNSSHFARTFRRVMGTTPQRFRREGAAPPL